MALGSPFLYQVLIMTHLFGLFDVFLPSLQLEWAPANRQVTPADFADYMRFHYRRALV